MKTTRMGKQHKKKNIPIILVGVVLLIAITSLRSSIGGGLVVGVVQVCALVIILYGFGMSWTRKDMRKGESNTNHLEVSDSKYKHKTTPHIAIIGLGGAGIATINRIASYDKLPTRRFIAIDSGSTAIDGSKATTKIVLDVKKDASDIEIMMAAHEAEDKIIDSINGTNIVFLIVSPSGNVGFNTWNIVTDILKKCQVLTVIFAIKPFSFEDAPKQEKALASIATMRNGATIFVEVSNDRMLQSTPKSVPLHESFKLMDYALVDSIERVHNFVAQNSTDDIDKIQDIMNYAVRNLVDGNE